MLHDLMQSHDYRSNAAVARVNARVKDACVCLTKLIYRVLVQNTNDFVKPNLSGGPSQRVPTARTALRLHQSSLIQNPQQLAGVGHRQTFALRNLCEGQQLALSLRARKLNETPQTIFFVSRNLHYCSGFPQDSP